jgi:MFS family permease
MNPQARTAPPSADEAFSLPMWPVFLASMPFFFLNFSLPIYARNLGANATEVGAMFAIFTVTTLCVRPLVGWALDRYSRRPFFIAAFTFYLVSMVVFSAVDSLTHFYVARFLQGIGASLMWVTTRVLIAQQVEANTRGLQMGRLAGKSAQGSLVGAFYGFTLIGFLPGETAWTISFAGYAVAAFIALAVSTTMAATSRPREHLQREHISLAGIDTRIKKLFVIVFVTSFANALTLPIYLLYLQDTFSLAYWQLGLAFFPAGIVFSMLPAYAGRWSDQRGRIPMIFIGLLMAGSMSLILPFAGGIVQLAVTYLLFSAGWAIASPAEDALLADWSGEGLQGRIFGFKEAVAGMGATAGPLVGGVIYDLVSMELAFVINGVLLLLTALLARLWVNTTSA